MSLSEEEYLRYLDDFNSFPLEPATLRDFCFYSEIDATTTTLILDLAETVMESQQLQMKTSEHLKYQNEEPISEGLLKQYKFLKTKIDYWMAAGHVSHLRQSLLFVRPYSASYLKYNKITKKKEPRKYVDDVLQRVEHYSDMLEPIAHSLQVIYS